MGKNGNVTFVEKSQETRQLLKNMLKFILKAYYFLAQNQIVIQNWDPDKFSEAILQDFIRSNQHKYLPEIKQDLMNMSFNIMVDNILLLQDVMNMIVNKTGHSSYLR